MKLPIMYLLTKNHVICMNAPHVILCKYYDYVFIGVDLWEN
jgi:hypothetical protein